MRFYNLHKCVKKKRGRKKKRRGEGRRREGKEKERKGKEKKEKGREKKRIEKKERKENQARKKTRLDLTAWDVETETQESFCSEVGDQQRCQRGLHVHKQAV